MSTWPTVQNSIVVGVAGNVALSSGAGQAPPPTPPGQLDFSKARNSGLLILRVP